MKPRTMLWLLFLLAGCLALSYRRYTVETAHTEAGCRLQGGRWYRNGSDRANRPTYTCLDPETGETL